MYNEALNWSVDCDRCGNVALARVKDPRSLMRVVHKHEQNSPGHYVIVSPRDALDLDSVLNESDWKMESLEGAIEKGETAEQQARDLLERYGIANAQSWSAGDLVELANFIADARAYRRTKGKGGGGMP